MLLWPYVSCQHVPHWSLFQLGMTPAPPMYGKDGRLLKVGNLRSNPCDPSEHAVMASEFEPSSYVWSYETETEEEVVAPSALGRRAARRVRVAVLNCIVGESVKMKRRSGCDDEVKEK